MNIRNQPQSELIFAPAADRALSSRMQRKAQEGTAIRIARGIYTTQTVVPLEVVVRRNWKSLVEHELPGAVLCYKSARIGGPDETGNLVVCWGKRPSARRYPGLDIQVRPGGPDVGDTPYGGLFLARESRWLLECLEAVKGSSTRTLPQNNIEAYLNRLLQVRGKGKFNDLRDEARIYAAAHDRTKEFTRLDQLMSELMRTREANQITSKQAKARAAGKPYDPDRLLIFDTLFAQLQQTPLPAIAEVALTAQARDNQAFFEAYFSNYIEGTTFTVEEAEDIVYHGVVLTDRLEDTHDILGTYNAAITTPWRDVFPTHGPEFLDWIRSVNALVMGKRPDKNPGMWKDKANQAGSTLFVHPDLVRGTLLEGFDRAQALTDPAARAFMIMFVVVEVHPFIDGNGRTARLALNCILTQADLARILVPTVYREDYLLPLKQLSHQQNPRGYVNTMERLHDWSAKLAYDQSKAGLYEQLKRCNAFQENRNAYRLIDPE